MSEGVEWGIHCCTVLAVLPTGATLPASRLAEYHGVPAAYLAKHMQALSKAGIVESVAGPKGGYRLAKPPAEITVLDVVLAIEGAEPACLRAAWPRPTRWSPPPDASRNNVDIRYPDR